MTNPRNPLAIAKRFTLYGKGLVAHQITGEVTTITLKRKLKGGGLVNVLAAAAQGLLTLTGNAADADTVTVGATVYTFESVFSDQPNHVLIGADAEATAINLVGAINGIKANAGSTHGTGTLAHDDVLAVMGVGDSVKVTALLPGTAGNTIATTQTLTAGTWGAATLTAGTDGRAITLADGWTFGTPRPREGMVLLQTDRAAERVFTIAAHMLTEAQARAGAVIDRGAFRYTVDFDAAPEGFDQAWTFKVTKREAI